MAHRHFTGRFSFCSASVCVAAALLGPSRSCADDQEPVRQLKAILAKLEQYGTREKGIKVTAKTGRFSSIDRALYPELEGVPGSVACFRHRFTASRISYDVRKTDSLVSPLVAEVYWVDRAYGVGPFSSEAEAWAADLPSEGEGGTAHALFAYQDGQWVLKSVKVTHRGLKYRDEEKDWLEALALTDAERQEKRNELAAKRRRAAEHLKARAKDAEVLRRQEEAARTEQERQERVARQKAQEQARREAADALRLRDEQAAAGALRLIRQNLADGKAARARERLQSLIDRYPDTKAAGEARRLLKTLETSGS